MKSERHSFIVRIWHEEEDEEGHGPVWRGSIDHVGSGRRLYFCDLEGILGFIREQLGLNVNPRHPKWKSILRWIRNESA
jgi:hypothetical protein